MDNLGWEASQRHFHSSKLSGAIIRHFSPTPDHTISNSKTSIIVHIWLRFQKKNFLKMKNQCRETLDVLSSLPLVDDADSGTGATRQWCCVVRCSFDLTRPLGFRSVPVYSGIFCKSPWVQMGGMWYNYCSCTLHSAQLVNVRTNRWRGAEPCGARVCPLFCGISRELPS